MKLLGTNMAQWSSKMATIRKRQNRYHTQVRKNGISITKSFTNKLDAQKWAKEQEVKIEQGAFTTIKIKEEVVTLEFLLNRWEKEILFNLKSWSVERYKVGLVSKALGHLTLDKITSTSLVSYRDGRLGEVSNQTVKHELGLIKRAMKKGIEWGYISSVPYVTSPFRKVIYSESLSDTFKSIGDDHVKNKFSNKWSTGHTYTGGRY
jgi:hypothetical protein